MSLTISTKNLRPVNTKNQKNVKPQNTKKMFNLSPWIKENPKKPWTSNYSKTLNPSTWENQKDLSINLKVFKWKSKYIK